MISDTLPIDSLPEPHDPSPNPEALAIETQRQERICALFSQLFGNDAALLIALYFDGMTAQDVALQFGKTFYEVHYIRRKALRTLRVNDTIAELLRS